MPVVIGLFDKKAEAMRAYDALVSRGFRSADLDILTSDDQDDKPKLAALGKSVREPDVHVYLEGVRQGGTLITVNASEDKVAKAAEVMSGYEMVNIDARLKDLRRTKSNLQLTDPKADQHVFEVVEEVMDVGKKQIERGRMRVYSTVSEREVAQQVGLRDETIRVQRRPVSRSVADERELFKERSVEMTEVDEEAVVTKSARVIEEVVIGKDVAEKMQTIREKLRRTDVQIEDVPGVRAYDDYAGEFRGYYTQRLASRGIAYERLDPAFRYGHSLGTKEPFRSQDWATIEPDIRRLWEEKNPRTWDDVKDAVHYAWQKVRGVRSAA